MMRILQKCLIHKSTSATLRIPFGIRITPQFGLPNWVYPTLKMTKRVQLVVIIFSVGRAFRRSTTRQGQSPTPLRGVSSPLEKSRNIAPPVMKASPTRTKWLTDKVVAYASVFFSLPRPTFRRWNTTKLGLD